MSSSATQTKKVNDLIASVNKAMGRNVLRKGSDKTFVARYIPTGLLPVDVLLQGGLPVGRFTVIVGDYSTLKSYIGLCAIAQCQKAGGIAALIDTEKAFDPEWAESLGVNVDDLVMFPPKDADPTEYFPGELAIDAAEAMTRSGVDLIVFDSIAATLPQQEQNKRLWDENIQPARLAALMSAAGRRLTAANSKTAYLWINQFRTNVGMTFGDPNVMTGGKAMPYYASYILVAKKVGKITRDVKVHDGDKWKTTKEQITQKFQLSLTKSKLSKPFRDAYFDWDLINGQVDMAQYLISQGLETGDVTIVGKSRWETGNLSVNGKDKFKAAVAADPVVMRNLENKIRAASNLPVTPSQTGRNRNVKKSPLQQKAKRKLSRRA